VISGKLSAAELRRPISRPIFHTDT